MPCVRTAFPRTACRSAIRWRRSSSTGCSACSSLFLMALLGLTLARRSRLGPGDSVGACRCTETACAIAAVLVFSDAADAAGGNAARRRAVGTHPARAVGRCSASIRRYAHHHGALTNVLAASVAVQVLRVLQAYYLGAAIGVSQPLVDLLRVRPADPARHAAADHGQRHRHVAGGVRLVLRARPDAGSTKRLPCRSCSSRCRSSATSRARFSSSRAPASGAPLRGA